MWSGKQSPLPPPHTTHTRTRATTAHRQHTSTARATCPDSCPPSRHTCSDLQLPWPLTVTHARADAGARHGARTHARTKRYTYSYSLCGAYMRCGALVFVLSWQACVVRGGAGRARPTAASAGLTGDCSSLTTPHRPPAPHLGPKKQHTESKDGPFSIPPPGGPMAMRHNPRCVSPTALAGWKRSLGLCSLWLTLVTDRSSDTAK